MYESARTILPFCSLPDCQVPPLSVMHLKCSTKIRNICDTCKEIAENPEKNLSTQSCRRPSPLPLPIGRGVNSNEPIKQSLPPLGRAGGRVSFCCVQTLDGCRAEFRAMACRLWTDGG